MTSSGSDDTIMKKPSHQAQMAASGLVGSPLFASFPRMFRTFSLRPFPCHVSLCFRAFRACSFRACSFHARFVRVCSCSLVFWTALVKLLCKHTTQHNATQHNTPHHTTQHNTTQHAPRMSYTLFTLLLLLGLLVCMHTTTLIKQSCERSVERSEHS